MNTEVQGEVACAAAAVPRDSQRKKTVLIVDDDAMLLRGLQRQLADEPYLLLTAVSAAEAKAVLARHAVDLVISDNLMAGELGTDFLRDLHEHYPKMILMMLSGHVPHAARHGALEKIGVREIFCKPCAGGTIAEAIRRSLS